MRPPRCAQTALACTQAETSATLASSFRDPHVEPLQTPCPAPNVGSPLLITLVPDNASRGKAPGRPISGSPSGRLDRSPRPPGKQSPTHDCRHRSAPRWRRSARPAGVWSKPPTSSAASSNATCAKAPRSGSPRPPSCSPAAAHRSPRSPPDSRGQGRATRASARHPPSHPKRRRASHRAPRTRRPVARPRRPHHSPTAMADNHRGGHLLPVLRSAREHGQIRAGVTRQCLITSNEDALRVEIADDGTAAPTRQAARDCAASPTV
jgi:hypothetical protein